MYKKFLLFLLLCSIPLQLIADSWPCVIESGKGSRNCKVMAPLPLIELKNKILSLGIDPQKELGDYSKLAGKINVTYIGQLQGRKIYDLIYSYAGTEKSFIKIIAVEEVHDKFSPVYCRISYADQMEIRNSFLIHNKFILASKMPMSGSGGYWENFYLYFSPNFKIPKIIDETIINKTLTKILPKDYSILQGDPFDIKTLHFHSPVWKTDDGACCPTGGVVDLQFKLSSEGKLQLVLYNYKLIADS